MPSFLSGLTGALTGGATGYLQGDTATLRELVAEKARQRAEALAERKMANEEAMTAIHKATSGFTPASTSVSLEPPSLADDTAATAPATSFGDTFNAGLGATAPPLTMDVPDVPNPSRGPDGSSSSLAAPVPSLGTIPKVHVTSTPESYDPANSIQGYQMQGRATIAGNANESRETMNADRIAERDRKTAADNRTRIAVAQIRGPSARGGTGAAGARPITGTARETFNRQTAKAIIANQGSLADAEAWLAGPSAEAAAERANGVTNAHLTTAAGLQAVVNATMGARTNLPADAGDAVGRVTAIQDEARRQAAVPAALRQQRRDYDAAAEALTAQKKSAAEIAATLGPRP